MEKSKKRYKRWRFLYRIVRCFVPRRFNLEYEKSDIDAPCLIISNHVTSWDPLLLSMSFPETPIAFVASEHIFRLGLISRLIEKFVAPIPRRKASSGADTVMMCMRRLRAGDTVCIFAEGDATWNGVSGEVFPATGKLARSCGANLVTYRIEGAYLSYPRWAKTKRRGKARGHVVGVYTPEQLKAMKPDQITALINRDIHEDAWERQRSEHIPYSGEKLAEGIEQGYYICPRCRKIGSVKGRGSRISCSCGFETAVTAEGFLSPPEPFETLEQWDSWQTRTLKEIMTDNRDMLFADDGACLAQVGLDHSENALGHGRMELYSDRLICAGHEFRLEDISSMAMVKSSILLFSENDKYYEIRASKDTCLRKYLTAWGCK